jgi:hypothetical protein
MKPLQPSIHSLTPHPNISNTVGLDDLTMLRECEEEYARRGHFQRIFPTPFNVGLYRRYFSRYDGSSEGGVPRSDLLLWEWIQLRYLLTCGSDEAFERRDVRRIKRRMKYLRKRQMKKSKGEGGEEKVSSGLFEPPRWERLNGSRKDTTVKSNLGYYCSFCGIVHYNDPIQV